MTPEEFVREFWILKKNYLRTLNEGSEQTGASILLSRLNLNEEQRVIFQKLLDTALTDVLYAILLGLDGEAQIGEKQITYSVADEQGSQLCGTAVNGEVEGFAYEYFYGSR